MLSIVHTAEVRFRHESSIRDRELAILASIRDRQSRVADEQIGTTRVVRAAFTWPRPIGVQRARLFEQEPCPAVA